MNHTAAAPQSSFVVVSNRLPVDRVVDHQGREAWSTTPGGLVAALQPVMADREAAWVGWPGQAEVSVPAFSSGSTWYHPVTISATDLEGYYEGFSNSTLWPLYHDAIVAPDYQLSWWESYQRVTSAFADRVVDIAASGATVWVHDYQLQLLPQMLRERRPDLTIGYFHHIPFPPVALLSEMPWCREILDGLLGADLVGCQRPGDAANLREAASDLLGLEVSQHAVWARDGRLVAVDAFPISLDARSIDELASRAEVATRARQIREELGNPRHLFLGVDRLDYTKGIGHRLATFEELLREGELQADTSVFVQLASPSRESVAQYQRLREDIEAQVTRINDTFGAPERPAVVYRNQNIARDEMMAYYRAADVMVVSPLRDGMNLVAKEFVATRRDESGVLVLSEFTGAADELTEALLVDPTDLLAMKRAFMVAATMSPEEQQRRMHALRETVFHRDVTVWAREYLAALAKHAGDHDG